MKIYRLTLDLLIMCFYPIENMGPFLRPMSGMAEEEGVEYNIIKYPICPEDADDYAGLIDWFNAHTVD